MTIRDLNLTDITVDDEILLRPLDERLAKRYAAAMRHREPFPPVDVFYDGKVYRLADGRHRVRAALLAKHSTIRADVEEGGFREAYQFAAGANETHGERRNNTVKRAYVRGLLLDDEWRDWSNRELARVARVEHHMVVKMRGDMEAAGEIPPRNKKAKFKRGGKVHKMTTKQKHSSSGGAPRRKQVANSPRLNANDRRARDICLAFVEDNQTSPYDGAEAVRRWGAYEWLDKFKRTRLWLSEAIEECERSVKKD